MLIHMKLPEDEPNRTRIEKVALSKPDDEGYVVVDEYNTAVREILMGIPAGSPMGKASPQQDLPTWWDMQKNFGSAMVEWTKAGWKLVDKEEFERRMAICRSCPEKLWEEDGNLKLGKCNHKSCGCTKGKQWLISSICPLELWGDEKYLERYRKKKQKQLENNK